MPQVKIGSSYFRKSLNDYSNWKWAWGREAAQNAIDAGAKSITITVETSGQNQTIVRFADDGCGMDQDTITEKLFAIGESGKNFEGSVGGFGIAKVVLYCAHDAYEIHTRDLLVKGSGGSYEISKTDYRQGTEVAVTFPGLIADELARNLRHFFQLCGWRGEITINGETVNDRLNKGAYRKSLDWCDIHTNKSFSGLMVVRLGSQPMFTRSITYGGCVVITLEGESAKYLTSNRDGLSYQYQRELDEFVAELTVNKRSVWKPKRTPKRSCFDGYELAGCLKSQVNDDQLVELKSAALYAIADVGQRAGQPGKDAIKKMERTVSNVTNMKFHIKSELDMEIPKYYTPVAFSDYSRCLAERYASALLEFALLTGNDKPFSIGFCFDDDSIGECEGDVLYVNPIVVVNHPGKSRSLRRRWTFNSAGNWDLVATAAHEWNHFEGHQYHDEDYAGRLTELMAMALNNRERFGKIFCGQGRVRWK